MKKLMALAVTLLPIVVIPARTGIAGETIADEDEDDATLYMLQLNGAENVSSTASIRVKIFPHERDYLPHGKDEVLDQFTIRSEIPCTIFKASKNQIAPAGVLQKDQLLITMKAQELQQPVIIDCPEQFTLERNFDDKMKALSYSGLLYVHTVQKQEQLMLEAVNVVSLRGYLRGVVPSEVFHHWPMETLKSQAVAARTYAVFHILRARRYAPTRFWDVDDTVMYQAYTGVTHRKEKTDEAVFATEGQILMYQGQVIQAFYHADSGGATEEANTIWDQPAPFTVARPEASDLEMNGMLWERTFSLTELTQKMAELGFWTKERPIKRVVVPMVGQTNSGRVKAVTMIDAKGEYVIIPTRTFKRVVGTLPSNLFVVDPAENGQILIKGVGFGHGVGMSQQGAAALAERKSWNYRQILDYYYVHTSICSIDTQRQRERIPDCGREAMKYMKQVAQHPLR
ncbi:SpoIID/LytB domain-containing protein [Oligoflexus tunisiensis]|uniref:SpoIID/LytB domain-containing protein n=1 Tax=Oligoflexus tunisiensis TaxID=708132 RepID=UPI00159F02CC|nr:SpoIID/LytB domain-containing protein [Oligoflexus tunisiensis]